MLAEPFSWRMGVGAAVVLVGIGLVKSAADEVRKLKGE